MDLKEAVKKRHSVRSYLDEPLDKETVASLKKLIDECNRECGLHIQLVTNEPKAFDCAMARRGGFKGVKNYIALIGKKEKDLDERLGYCGEKIVLYAQTLGLKTCWVAATYKKVPSAYVVGEGEKLAVVISIGYSDDNGSPHKSKTYGAVTKDAGRAPHWFREGIDAALLAPTAMDQQRFTFSVTGDTVTATAPRGRYTNIDLGIAKYNFEIGAGKENFVWG